LIWREYLDHLLFWTTADLENKLLDFKNYFNNYRTHTSREGRTPDTPVSRPIANLRSFRLATPLPILVSDRWLANCYFAHNSLDSPRCCHYSMRHLFVLFFHLIANLKLLKELAWNSSFRQRMPLLDRMD
jgi:hypothetical protein